MTNFYLNRDNSFNLSLTSDGAAFPLDSVTKVELKHSAGVLDNIANPTVLSIVGNEIAVNLGLSDLTPGVHTMALIVYDAVRLNGIVWDPALNFKVQDI